jgi:dynein heavy chain
MTKFQKIMLIKLLRKDCLITSVQSFITEALGSKFLTPSVPTLQDLYNLSIPQSPIIFILSPGLLFRLVKSLK